VQGVDYQLWATRTAASLWLRGRPLQPAEDLPQHRSEHTGGGRASGVVRVQLVALIIFAPTGVECCSGAPKRVEVQQIATGLRRGTSPSAVVLPVRLDFGVGPKHRSRGHQDRHTAVAGAVSATAIARAKDRSAISRVESSLPLQVWINAACGLRCWMTHVPQLQKPLELRPG
jgi:hypothetical protein